MCIDKKYESALADSDGWIEWGGGECPVDIDAIIGVKYRKPNTYQFNNDRAGDFTWSHTGSNGDIIAYRLHKPGIKSRANDDRLEQDLNECIGQGVDVPEWNGDGVPPVGCACEMQDSKGTWLPVEIIAKNDGFTFGWSYDYRLVFFGDKADEFRPLRTEAEKAREAAEKLAVADIINEMKMDENSLRDVIIAQKLYRAVCEGRIRGVNAGDK